MEKLIKDLTDMDITFGYNSKGFLTFPISKGQTGKKFPYYRWSEDFFEELYGKEIAKQVKKQTNKNPFLKSELEKEKKGFIRYPTIEKLRPKPPKSSKKIIKIGGMPEPQKKLIKLAKKGKEKIIQSQKEKFRKTVSKDPLGDAIRARERKIFLI